MSSFLTALTSIANQYGTAKNEAREEEFARGQKIEEMDIRKAQAELEKQAGQRQQKELELRQKEFEAKPPYFDIGLPMFTQDGQRYKRLWNIKTGKLEDVSIPTSGGMGGIEALKRVMQGLSKDQQALVQSTYESEIGASGDESKAIEKTNSLVEKLAEANQRHGEHEEDVKNQQQFQRDQRRQMENFQKSMVDFRLADKQKYMTPAERVVYDAIKQAEPMVNRLTNFIEQNNLQGENSFVFGKHSSLAQYLRFHGQYKRGVDPEKITSELIKDSALLQVAGAKPWMTMGRSRYMYETIVQHLPQPTDTPGLLYSKVTWLRDNVLEPTKAELADYVTPGIGGGGGNDNPLGLTLTPQK